MLHGTKTNNFATNRFFKVNESFWFLLSMLLLLCYINKLFFFKRSILLKHSNFIFSTTFTWYVYCWISLLNILLSLYYVLHFVYNAKYQSRKKFANNILYRTISFTLWSQNCTDKPIKIVSQTEFNNNETIGLPSGLKLKWASLFYTSTH